MRSTRMFSQRTGGTHEGGFARDEEHAISCINAHNWRCHRLKEEAKAAKAAAAKEEMKSRITLPKLKFMGDK